MINAVKPTIESHLFNNDTRGQLFFSYSGEKQLVVRKQQINKEKMDKKCSSLLDKERQNMSFLVDD